VHDHIRVRVSGAQAALFIILRILVYGPHFVPVKH